MTPAAKFRAELDRFGLTPAERAYAIKLARRFIGYTKVWVEVKDDSVRPIATVAGIVAAVKALEDVMRSENFLEALQVLMALMPEK